MKARAKIIMGDKGLRAQIKMYGGYVFEIRGINYAGEPWCIRNPHYATLEACSAAYKEETDGGQAEKADQGGN